VTPWRQFFFLCCNLGWFPCFCKLKASQCLNETASFLDGHFNFGTCILNLCGSDIYIIIYIHSYIYYIYRFIYIGIDILVYIYRYNLVSSIPFISSNIINLLVHTQVSHGIPQHFTVLNELGHFFWCRGIAVSWTVRSAAPAPCATMDGLGNANVPVTSGAVQHPQERRWMYYGSWGIQWNAKVVPKIWKSS
jgi:hypothetical protein